MSSKTKFLFINIFLIIILLTLIFYNFIKTQIVFEINGESEIYVEANTKYKDLGATAVKYNLIFEEKKVDIIIENNVNTKKVGKYLVKYILNDSDVKLKKIRTVHIVDTTKPEIKIFQKEIISCNKELKK